MYSVGDYCSMSVVNRGSEWVMCSVSILCQSRRALDGYCSRTLACSSCVFNNWQMWMSTVPGRSMTGQQSCSDAPVCNVCIHHPAFLPVLIFFIIRLRLALECKVYNVKMQYVRIASVTSHVCDSPHQPLKVQEAMLPPRDRATRWASSTVINCINIHTEVFT